MLIVCYTKSMNLNHTRVKVLLFPLTSFLLKILWRVSTSKPFIERNRVMGLNNFLFIKQYSSTKILLTALSHHYFFLLLFFISFFPFVFLFLVANLTVCALLAHILPNSNLVRMNTPYSTKTLLNMFRKHWNTLLHVTVKERGVKKVK